MREGFLFSRLVGFIQAGCGKETAGEQTRTHITGIVKAVKGLPMTSGERTGKNKAATGGGVDEVAMTGDA